MIPEFLDLLLKMKDIHHRKNTDYAAPANPFENFERSALLMEWFPNPADKAFVSLIGTKLARLATLLNNGGTPQNESVADSFLDLTTYCALWASYRQRHMTTAEPTPTSANVKDAVTGSTSFMVTSIAEDVDKLYFLHPEPHNQKV